MPASEIAVYILIEIELPLFDEPQHTGGEHWLADRSGEKERRRVHGLAAAECLDAEPPGPDHPVSVPDGDADARATLEPHPLEQIERRVGVIDEPHRRAQPVL